MKNTDKKITRIVVTLMAVMMSFAIAWGIEIPVNAADVSAFAPVFDATYYADNNADLKAVFGTDENALLNHFITCGMAEGRQGNAEFNVQAYKARYADLQAAFGEELSAYYYHYISSGKAEGRDGTAGATEISTGTKVVPVPVSVSATPATWEEQVIALVNADRAAYGLSPLTLDSRLMAAANARANEIDDYFSHTRPDGRSCFTVFSEYGAKGRVRGENIACGQRSPQAVETAWMNSPGHRANILDPEFTNIGIGLYQCNDRYHYYWVQLFAG